MAALSTVALSTVALAVVMSALLLMPAASAAAGVPDGAPAATAPPAAVGGAGQSPGIERLIPDSASFVLWIDDAPRFIEQWKASPVARLWNDPQVQQFFAPMRTSLDIDHWEQKVKEETGYELEELLDMLDGGVVLYLTDMGEFLGDLQAAGTDAEKDDVDLPMAMLAELGDKGDEVRELLLRKAEEAEKEQAEEGDEVELVTEEYRDVEYYIGRSFPEEGEPKDDFAWTVVNGVLVLTPGVELLEKVIGDVLDGGAELTLDSSAVYQSVERVVDPGGATLYWNLQHVVPALREMAIAAADESAGEGEAGSQMPFSPEVAIDALGLDGMQAAFVNVNLDGGAVSADLGLTYSDAAGILKVLAYGPGEAPRSKMIPANAISFGTSTFDFKTAWDSLETMLNTISPALMQMAAMQVNTAFQNAGVEIDLRHDILESLGQQILMAQVEPKSTTPDAEQPLTLASQVIAIQITERQGFETAIESLKAMTGQGSEMFEKREYLDTTIYTLKQQGGGQAFSYAVTDSWLLVGIGTSDALESMLIAQSKPEASVWDRPEVKRALAAVPAGAAAFSFNDVATTGPRMFSLLALAGSMSGGDEPMVDPSAVPDDDVFGKYFGPAVSAFYKDSRSMVVRVRMLQATGAATP